MALFPRFVPTPRCSANTAKSPEGTIPNRNYAQVSICGSVTSRTSHVSAFSSTEMGMQSVCQGWSDWVVGANLGFFIEKFLWRWINLIFEMLFTTCWKVTFETNEKAHPSHDRAENAKFLQNTFHFKLSSWATSVDEIKHYLLSFPRQSDKGVFDPVRSTTQNEESNLAQLSWLFIILEGLVSRRHWVRCRTLLYREWVIVFK